ncbi:heavy metal sensor histidine kinase [Marinobacterium weihaiense]|uniref:Sensor protein n=1 Tax=Marinobacterium weihaiense TaxID=2851016 RepID=A0ABS6MBX3_9GAMM|nr:heavy metal sensor histidine kinase [Marinobacterium weihaiense]MBV0933807.1 heavy metal sensor histidine kinase [Marinobacterium weihaiense]
MSLWPRSLSLRLALLFALVSTLVLGSIGFYLYQSLYREIAWRDDQALQGRLERMHALLDDSASIAALRERPQLYGNMLGNRQSLLWILDTDGQALIEINPAGLAIPTLPPAEHLRFARLDGQTPARLAWVQVRQGERSVTLIAGKLLAERNQMLAAYRLKLGMALAAGALLAFALGGLISQRGLRPVRHLAARAARIDAQHLYLRLDDRYPVSELHALSQALNQMLARLEDGFAQLSRFSEDLAHEMRTPLSNLMGQTQQTLRHPRTRDEYESLLVSNLEEYERLARMIDSMLFLARTEQPKASLNAESLPLSELVEQLSEYFEGVAEDRGLQLINQATHEVCADRDLLRRALANLIANALRYADDSSPILISSHDRDAGIEIRVHNQGPAIAAEHLPRLFERFYRCDPARAESGDCGGLGLAIVRSIMQLHGGRADVSSDAQGTCFTLWLPRR